MFGGGGGWRVAGGGGRCWMSGSHLVSIFLWPLDNFVKRAIVTMKEPMAKQGDYTVAGVPSNTVLLTVINGL